MSDAIIDVEVSHLSKTFQTQKEGEIRVLSDISFKVKRGEFFCIVGPSGCGKSTLLKILLGLESSSNKSVPYITEERKARIAYIPQDPLLIPWRTLYQNAAIGLEVKNALTKDDKGFIQNLIYKYRLNDLEDRLPSQLSGGERQRASVIRALASSPKILFCDEPFSSVDFVTKLDLNTKFKNMALDDTTVIFVTHNIEEAIFLGDRVAVMTSRPGNILDILDAKLSVGSENAVKCRQAPEFSLLFNKIWNLLEEGHAI